jgi:CDP-glucose 4,6-dehydratase
MENMVASKIQNLQNANVLVTGGTGIIGSWLVEELLSHNINSNLIIWGEIENPKFTTSSMLTKTNNLYGSLTDFEFIKSCIINNKIDVVFHLGAQAIVETAYDDPLTTYESNIRGTYNLLEACRISTTPVKAVIVASSDKAYGTHEKLPYTENTNLQGVFPYEVSKSCTDLIAQSYAATYNLPVGIARCGNVYGGGDMNWNRIVPSTIADLFNNKAPIIRSDGSNLRDYIYVKDIVDAYITLAETVLAGSEYGQAFNFGNNQPLSVIDIVKTISNLMNKEELSPQILNSAHGEIHSQYLDCTKAKQILNWQPSYSLKNGMSETINWYNEFLSNYHE